MTPPTRVIGRRAKPPDTEIYCMKFAGWCKGLFAPAILTGLSIRKVWLD